MTLLANILWFVIGGWLVGLVYLLGAIVFFPLLPFLWPLVKFSFWPFGTDIVSRSELELYQEVHEVEVARNQVYKNAVGCFGNLLWAVTFGWVLATIHFLLVLVNLSLFWMIVTIPNIGGHWKLIGVSFAPFNRVIVPSSLASEIRLTASKARFGVKN